MQKNMPKRTSRIEPGSKRNSTEEETLDPKKLFSYHKQERGCKDRRRRQERKLGNLPFKWAAFILQLE
jgi:hypothetical protein